ncbi:MAG TPA: hypothetical protein VFC45_14020 [Pseudolabrys sp.]|nr:hypothetical protein [Pseudolabrys sp.]
MPRRLLSYVVTAWVALAVLDPAWAQAFAAEVVFPAGSRVGLELPGGDLKPSARFPGFEDIDRKVSITVIDLPAAAYPELERAAESKIQPSLTDPKREDFSFRSGAGKLISAQAQGTDFKTHRWTLVAAAPADKDLAMAINVDVPEAALAVYSDAAIRKALATVTFRPTPIQEQLGLLPFKVGELAGFRVVKALAPGSVIMTEGPSDEIVKQPFIVISIGQGAPEQPDDRAKFARDMLSSAPLRELIPQSAEAMRIGGVPGFEIRADAKGPGGDQLSLVQWVRFGGGSYLRVIGVGRKADWDTLFPRFRAVRDGIAMR